MRGTESSHPLPAALVADMNPREQEVLEHRLKRGYPIFFRTRTGILMRVNWSAARGEFRLTNSMCLAVSCNAKPIFLLIAQMNVTPEQIEVAA